MNLVKERMLDIAEGEPDDKTICEMKRPAYELGSIEDGAHIQAMLHAAQMPGSGSGGYTVGFMVDNFASVEVLLK